MNERLAGGLIAVTAFVTGYLLVVRPLEERIASQVGAVAAAQRTADEQFTASVRTSALTRERERLRTDLAAAHLDARRTAAIERFLDATVTSTARRNTVIREVRSAPASPSPKRSGGPAAVLDEIPLQLTLRGPYPALLDTIRDLIAAPLAARIVVDALGPDQRPSARNDVLATLRVGLFYLTEGPRVLNQSR